MFLSVMCVCLSRCVGLDVFCDCVHNMSVRVRLRMCFCVCGCVDVGGLSPCKSFKEWVYIFLFVFVCTFLGVYMLYFVGMCPFISVYLSHHISLHV